MHREIDELRPKLKEILYDCAVDLKATKAALYLLDTSVRKFELVADFGFRFGVRPWIEYNDWMVDHCSRGRSPFFVNSADADPKLAQILFETVSERLLGAPLFLRGQLIGFIDIRDKQGKQPFEKPDVAVAQSIADRLLELLTPKNVWNQRVITLADVPVMPGVVKRPEAPRPAATPETESTMERFHPAAGPDLRYANPAQPATSATPATPVIPAQPPTPAPPLTPAPPATPAQPSITAHRATVKRAREVTSVLLVPPFPDELTEAELTEARESLRAILLLPGVVAAAFTATTGVDCVEEIAAKGPLTADGEAAFQAKLQGWLKQYDESVGELRNHFQTPLGVLIPEISAAQMQKFYFAPITVGSLRGMYLTIAFSDQPDPATRELLAVMLNDLQTSIEHSILLSRMQVTRLRVALKLVEPDFAAFPALRRHSDEVAARSEAFSRHLGMTGAEVEDVKITALVHDVGMRLLDYEHLYRKKELTGEELALLREHVSVGAALVEPLLGPEIARSVLCHHERADGAGYPNRMRGADIPLPSRILQLADAYVAITDPQTYRTPDTRDNALATIERGAGAQFDAELAGRFIEMMKST